MTTTGGPTGPGGINIPVHISLNRDHSSEELLRLLKIVVEQDERRAQGLPPSGGGSGIPRKQYASQQAHNAGILAAQAAGGTAPRTISTVTPRAARANASPGAQPLGLSALRGGIGAINSAVMGWQQMQRGGLPTSTAASLSSWAGLKGTSKFFKSLKGLPSYSDFTQNRTSNTSYLGSTAGGLFNNLERFADAYGIAGKAGAGLGAKGVAVAAGAAVVYKAAELAARVGSTTTAWALKSGEKAMKTPGGQFFNDASSTFDYINNYAPAIQQSYKTTAKFDDAVAAVTGTLPDTSFYEPQFFRLSKAQFQFESMVKRNFAMTKAGAMGNSNVSDQVRDTFFNAAMQQ